MSSNETTRMSDAARQAVIDAYGLLVQASMPRPTSEAEGDGDQHDQHEDAGQPASSEAVAQSGEGHQAEEAIREDRRPDA